MNTEPIAKWLIEYALTNCKTKRSFNMTLVRLSKVCKDWHAISQPLRDFSRRYPGNRTRILFDYYSTPKRWRPLLYRFVNQRLTNERCQSCAQLAATLLRSETEFRKLVTGHSQPSEEEARCECAAQNVVALLEQYEDVEIHFRRACRAQHKAALFSHITEERLEIQCRMRIVCEVFDSARHTFLHADRTLAEARWRVYHFAVENNIKPLVEKISFVTLALTSKVGLPPRFPSEILSLTKELAPRRPRSPVAEGSPTLHLWQIKLDVVQYLGARYACFPSGGRADVCRPLSAHYEAMLASNTFRSSFVWI